MLLRRLCLQTNESISSLLMRLSRANHYQPLTILSDQIHSSIRGEGQIKDRLACPYQPSTYEYIAAIAKLEVSVLYAATPHSFAHVITPSDNTINQIKLLDGTSAPLLAPGIASKQLRPTRTAQFCPLCLKAAPYHRLIWVPTAVSACLEHQCLLLTNCQSCGKKVSVHDIIAAQCSACGSSLTEAETLSLDGDKFGLFSQYLFNPGRLIILIPPITPKNCLSRHLGCFTEFSIDFGQQKATSWTHIGLNLINEKR